MTRRLSRRVQITCRPVRNEVGVFLRTVEEEMLRWREQFQVVLNHEEPPKPCEVQPSDELNIRTGHITRDEIKSSIKNLKNRKAPGCDNIPPEAIKAGDQGSEEVFLDLCNQIQSKEQVPEGFVTKNCCVSYVKIREYTNFVSNLLAYLISAVSS